MKKSLIALAMAGMALASGAASAADEGIYAFGTVGQQSINKSIEGMSTNGTQYQFGVGLQLSKAMAFEASWLNATHNTEEAGLDVNYEGAVVGVRGFYPVNDKLSMTGKVGMAIMSVDVGDMSSDGTSLLVGVGAEYKLTPQSALTVNYEFMDKPADTTRSLGAFSVGLKYKF